MLPVTYTGSNSQIYWAFGLCPSSGILGTREHKVSGFLRGPTEQVSPPSPEDGNRSNFQNVVLMMFILQKSLKDEI
jgi:hypothetical protein